MPPHQSLPPGRGKVRMGVERWKCRNIPIVPPLYPHPSLPPARGKEQNAALLSSYEII